MWSFNLPVLLRKPGQSPNPRFVVWPLELGLGTRNPCFVAWPLELGLGTRNPRFVAWPLELGLGTRNPCFVAWPLELGLGTRNPQECKGDIVWGSQRMHTAQCNNLNSSFYVVLQPSGAVEETGTIFVTLLLCVALCCVSLRSS